MAHTLWVATREGLFALRAGATRRSWKLSGPQFLGHIIHHVVQDPREPRVVLMRPRADTWVPRCFVRAIAAAAGSRRVMSA